jgi:hypothetical protein
MKMTIDSGIMKDILVNYDRDYFTFEALDALIDFYDEVDPDYDFDPIGICCDWNEYGKTPCLGWKDLISDYSYLLDEDEDLEEDEEPQEWSEEEKIEAIIEALEDKTTVIRLSNSVLVTIY